MDLERVKFCAKVFRAFGVEFRILAEHRLTYIVGESWQCHDVESLERKAKQMLQYRNKLK